LDGITLFIILSIIPISISIHFIIVQFIHFMDIILMEAIIMVIMGMAAVDINISAQKGITGRVPLALPMPEQRAAHGFVIAAAMPEAEPRVIPPALNRADLQAATAGQ
jgi:hypothetical protein